MDIKSVKKLHALTGHRDSIYTVQCGKTAQDLFSAGGDGMVVRWNMEAPESGELIAQLPNSIYALHHLKDEDQLIAAQNFEGIHLLDYVNKKEIKSLKLTDSYIFDLKSDKNKIFVAAADGVIYVVDKEQWIILDRLEYAQKSARAMAIHKERNELVVGYSDNFIRVFDLFSHQMKQEWEAHNNSVFALQFTANGEYLLSGSRDAHLKVWDWAGNYELKEDIVAHMYTINHIAFSPDGKHFVTCSMDKSIKVWDSHEFKLLKVIDKARHAGHGTSVNKLEWTSFNNQLVSASDDRTLSIWEIIF
ncbi:MAG: WD40 repeat domain-containing protein [Cyclobacteriaceae bacterium]